MKYTAKGQNRRFELFDENERSLGYIDHTGWFPEKVQITTGNEVYKVENVNFWNTKQEIRKGEETVAEIKIKWAGSMEITMRAGGTYVFKPDFWHSTYTLYTEHGAGIAVVRSDFKWSKFAFSYDIETDDNYRESNNPLLLLILTYCCNNLKKRASAG
jgi:hypothetical protein